MSEVSRIKVWDPLVRWFHWRLVGAFMIAYITEEDFLTLHVWAGYVVLAAIAVRLVWGFIGTRHARFTDFVTKPSSAIRYVADTFRSSAKRYIGHNPAGGLMIVLLLSSLLLTGITGLLLYGATDQAGPFAHWTVIHSLFWEEAFEETHEFLANFTVFLVIVHLLGVLVESLFHRENLVRAMIDGYKRS